MSSAFAAAARVRQPDTSLAYISEQARQTGNVRQNVFTRLTKAFFKVTIQAIALVISKGDSAERQQKVTCAFAEFRQGGVGHEV